MNPTSEKIAIMQAYIDGKKIEFKTRPLCQWGDVTGASPNWNWGMYDYRVKKEPRILYASFGASGNLRIAGATRFYVEQFGDTAIEFVEKTP